MGLLEDLKAKADANGDGKLTQDDLQGLKDMYAENEHRITELQAKADANGDGKVDLSDAQGVFDGIVDNVKGMFGK